MTRSRFFLAVDEENLWNRLDKIATEIGVWLPLTTELRQIMYQSDKVENRFLKRKQAEQNHAPPTLPGAR